ncbi:MAG: hypothetical protein BMS9Abin08_0518 [Gammaproteobacteria bacterium]|nr:MAG: hypothetical protein BMS9Abin08_0518 [Gammaproteobacteria bacterium]
MNKLINVTRAVLALLMPFLSSGLLLAAAIPPPVIPPSYTLNLNGVDQWVQVTDSPALRPQNGITLEAWVRPATTTGCYTIVGKNWISGYWLGLCAGKIRYYTNGSGSAQDGSAVLNVGQWTHVAVTFDGNTRRYYVDGVLDLEAISPATLPSNTDDFGIGADYNQTFLWPGELAEVRLWNRTRTQTEIQRDLIRRIESPQTDLIASWSLYGDASEVTGVHDGSPVNVPQFNGSAAPAVPHNPVKIPLLPSVPSTNGICNAGEYSYLRMPIWYDNGVYRGVAWVFVGATQDDLHLCLWGLPINYPTATPFSGVYIDSAGDGGSLAQTDDFRVTLTQDGVLSSSSGNGVGGYNQGSGPANVNAIEYLGTGTDWSAEFRIGRNTLPAVNSVFGLQVMHSWLRAVGDDYGWPVDFDWNTPDAWEAVIVSERNATSLKLDLSSNSVEVGDPVTATVTLKVAGVTLPSSQLNGQLINLEITSPGGNIVSFPAQVNDSGVAVFNDLTDFTATGNYTVKATFPGTNQWQVAASLSRPVTVQIHAGYAVIIEGGYFLPGTAQQLSTEKSALLLNQSLLARGFTGSRIFYFGQDLDPLPDALTTYNNINTLLMSNTSGDGIYSLLEQVTANPAPIHFFMVGHAGSGGNFYLNANGGPAGNGEILTATQLDSWLDTLEQIPQVAYWPRTVIVATPYSAGFIPALSDASNASGRVIVASTTAGGRAFMGPEEQDGIPAGSYFLGELVEEWGKGKNLDESFNLAAQRTRELTRADDSVFSSAQQYVESSLQQPLLDDNADGIGTWRNTASSDGAVAATVFLGVGQTEADDTFVIPATQHLAAPGTFGLTVADIGATRSLWTVAVRAPGTGLQPASGPAQISLPYERLDMSLIYSDPDYTLSLYGVNYDFTQSGRYEIWLWGEGTAKDTVSKRLVVFVDDAGNTAPEAFVLERPEDGSTSFSVFDWSQSVDPDGDAVWYKVVISESPGVDTDGKLLQIDYESGELESSMWIVDENLGLKPQSNYYWQVFAFDRYGKILDSDIWGFWIPPEDKDWTVYSLYSIGIDGFVTNALNAGLKGAAIRWNGEPIYDGPLPLKSEPDGYYFINSDWLKPVSGTCGVDGTDKQYEGDLDPSLANYQVRQPVVGMTYCDASSVIRGFIMDELVDTDGDLIWDSSDNCKFIANADQSNIDGDETGDVCDPDKDGDFVDNGADAFELDWAASKDIDGDGVPDGWNTGRSQTDSTTGLTKVDNCTFVSNSDQRDTNGDGYGNICDPDLNGDLRVDFADLALLKAMFFTSGPNMDADLNPDGRVDFADLAIMKSMFFGPPGPSALAP